jgi:hypothetical protein
VGRLREADRILDSWPDRQRQVGGVGLTSGDTRLRGSRQWPVVPEILGLRAVAAARRGAVEKPPPSSAGGMAQSDSQPAIAAEVAASGSDKVVADGLCQRVTYEELRGRAGRRVAMSDIHAPRCGAGVLRDTRVRRVLDVGVRKVREAAFESEVAD